MIRPGPGWSTPCICLGRSSRHEASSTKRGPVLTRLRVGKHAGITEGECSSTGLSVEERGRVSGSVCAAAGQFDSHAIVELSCDWPASDDDPDKLSVSMNGYCEQGSDNRDAVPVMSSDKRVGLLPVDWDGRKSPFNRRLDIMCPLPRYTPCHDGCDLGHPVSVVLPERPAAPSAHSLLSLRPSGRVHSERSSVTGKKGRKLVVFYQSFYQTIVARFRPKVLTFAPSDSLALRQAEGNVPCDVPAS